MAATIMTFLYLFLLLSLVPLNSWAEGWDGRQNETTLSSSMALPTQVHLRIGVPKKEGFKEFVKVERNSINKSFVAGGFSIDVFFAVIRQLPFHLKYELIPYDGKNGNSNWTYSELLHQIPEEFDAVVGDISIEASRTYVDFTLPYTGSGVTMLVLPQNGRHLDMWIFLKPFSWDLWLLIVADSIFIGLVIRYMERNFGNGSPRNLLSICWLPLSQTVLPERESIARNWSRFVLAVWLLLAFVIMQSYTANLSSILTLGQLQSDYLTVEQLKNGRHHVGYQTGSFVYDMLISQLNFDKKLLKSYSDPTEYEMALSNGSVAAIFDEIPFIKVFLKIYGSKYMMAGPTYRTDGLGFAFPLNSNLTAYFSRAILNVSESNTMEIIEYKYFGNSDFGQDQLISTGQISSSNSSTPSLSTISFGGLFIITTAAIILALILSESVIWRTPVTIVRTISERILPLPSSSSPRPFRCLPTNDFNQSQLIVVNYNGVGNDAASEIEMGVSRSE